MESGDHTQLIGALVEAFPVYLGERLAVLGLDVNEPAMAAIAAASEQLRAGLESLLAQPVTAQEESPLEVVRRATTPVSVWLSSAGVNPVDRDPWEQEAHPEDQYDLFPASSRALGEEAWRLHLQWGIAKAEAVAAVVPRAEKSAALPSVALFGIAAEKRPRIQALIAGRGFHVLVWRNPAALAEATATRPILVVVGLGHPAAHEAIREVARLGLRVIAVGHGVDDLTTPGLMALGAEEVVESSRLLARLDGLLPQRA